ncbi:hypothetical protein KEM52_002720 [Ascosphaera acerosa]|nr:hypothetical protein KEM52_002720 [Ascosphaera acerosa]
MDDLPPRPQDPAAIDRLVQTLREGAERKKQKDGPFSCRCTAFRRANTPELESWKFAEWDFKRPGLPTYARGLFTARTGTEPHYEIVARGYDKFFSVGEVEDTQWRNIETRTRGPYEISQKENGCIIFISGLADGSLLVCSKHSTGPRPGPPPGQKSESESKQTTPAAGDTTVPIEEQLGKLSLAEATAQTSSPPVSPSHAEVGERWVHKHVASVGRTAADLARTLRALNLTAVGELCDDAFEEHVLPYAPERAGIYLHGLNYNLPEFATLPGDAVHAFADAWGFRKAQFLVKQTLAETREFLERCAETGSWNGRETEGFVVRCKKMQAPERDVTPPAPDFAATAAPAAPAAPAYTDWFFKYKFEEPYLMYRHWRECTMTLLSGGEPKVKKHPDSTRRYLQYVRRQLDADPGLADRYLHHRGIIALRDGFLRERYSQRSHSHER